MTVSKLPEDYGSLLLEVKERIRAAQYRALRAVNKELIGLYWDIGRMIVERQAGDTLGMPILQPAVGDLQKESAGIGGFSAPDLWRMKSFFEAYAGSEKLAHLVREIGRGHNPVILQRRSEPLERRVHLIGKRYEVFGV